MLFGVVKVIKARDRMDLTLAALSFVGMFLRSISLGQFVILRKEEDGQGGRMLRLSPPK